MLQQDLKLSTISGADSGSVSVEAIRHDEVLVVFSIPVFVLLMAALFLVFLCEKESVNFPLSPWITF